VWPVPSCLLVLCRTGTPSTGLYREQARRILKIEHNTRASECNDDEPMYKGILLHMRAKTKPACVCSGYVGGGGADMGGDGWVAREDGGDEWAYPTHR